jgi:hypothetical protein
MFDGQATVGACVSLTVTVKLQLPVLPHTSVAEQLTVTVPFWNVAPEATGRAFVVQLAVAVPSQLSLAVTVKLTTAEH